MFFPLMIDLDDKLILIVGGGKIAYRKAKAMLEFGAKLTIVSPDFLDEFKELEDKYKDEDNRLRLKYDEYDFRYIVDKVMVIAATSSREVNRQIVKDCNIHQVLVNNVDERDESDFITPAIYKNDNLTISISTEGSFPYLSKKIRSEMEKNYDKYNEEYTSVLEDVRYTIIKKHPNKKRQIMNKILELDIEGLKKFRDKYR